MQKYDFLCGGDRGAWECLVDVELSDEEKKAGFHLTARIMSFCIGKIR